MAGGVNLYAYAGNNPVAFTDPFGLCPPEDNNVDNCDDDNLGNAWRALKSAGAEGEAVIDVYVDNQWKVTRGDCTGTHTNNCSRLSEKTTFVDGSHPAGAIAVGLAHESVHITGKRHEPGSKGAVEQERDSWIKGMMVFGKMDAKYRGEAMSVKSYRDFMDLNWSTSAKRRRWRRMIMCTITNPTSDRPGYCGG